MDTFIHVMIIVQLVAASFILFKLEMNDRRDRRMANEFDNARGDGAEKVENEPPAA